MIQTYFDKQTLTQSKYLDELNGFLQIPSKTKNLKGINAVVNKLVKYMNRLGIETKIYRINGSNPFILGEIGQGKTTMLIYDHYDVMSEGDMALWKSPPFEPEIRGNKLYARGVADNKGNLILRLQAIKYILKGSNLPIKIKFIIEGEEEIGSPNLHRFSDKHGASWKDADLCLWETGEVNETGQPLMFLGMKGITYITLKTKIGDKDIHSGYASLVDSAAWRLVYALSSMRDRNGNVTIDGLTSKIKKPTKSERELMIHENWDPEKLLKSLGRKKFLSKNNKKIDILTRHYYGITCNICGIWSGNTNENELKTVLPNQAYAKIDLRLVEDIDSRKITQIIRKHLNKHGFKDIEVTEVINEPWGKSNLENKYFQKAIRIIQKSYKKKVVTQPMTKGSGPIYHVASKYGIPTIFLGASYIGATIHGPNEHIRLNDYVQGLNATINLIMNISK